MTEVSANRWLRTGGEARLATRISRTVVAMVFSSAFLVATASYSVEMLAVPSLRPTAAHTVVKVSEVRYQAPLRPKALIEHTVEESPFTIAAAAEPVEKASVLPEQEPESEVKKIEKPVKPKLVTKPKIQSPPKAEPQSPVMVAEPARVQEPTFKAAEAGSATGVSDARGNSDRDEAAMLAEIVRHIEARKSYPRRARQSSQEGIVTISIRVGSDGTVTDVSVSKKASSQILNRAAFAAASSLKGLRVAEEGRAVVVEVPVVFSLHSP